MNAGRPRLAVLVKTFPKVSETFILNELLALERAGIELEVFALRRPTENVTQPAVARLRAPVHYLEPATPPADGADDVARQALRLAALLRTRGCDHLHAHFVDGPGAVAERAAELAGIRFSLSAHAKDIFLCERTALRRRLARAAFTVTCTGYNAHWLAGVAPRGAVIRRMYHGIDTRQFAPCCDAHAAGAPRVLAVGRLRPKKGFATLLRACALLRDRGRDLRCDIVGYGEERTRLESLIGDLGLGDLARLRGRMTHDALIDEYRAATVFAMPCEIAADGDRDGIPNALLEAMSLALPVVTTAVSGIPEVVRDGVNGLVVRAGEPAALAVGIERLLDDPSTAQALGVAARASVIAHFDENANLRTLLDLLSTLRRRNSNVVDLEVSCA